MNRPLQAQIPQTRSIASDLKRVLEDKGDTEKFYRSHGLDAIAEVKKRGKVSDPESN